MLANPHLASRGPVPAAPYVTRMRAGCGSGSGAAPRLISSSLIWSAAHTVGLSVCPRGPNRSVNVLLWVEEKKNYYVNAAHQSQNLTGQDSDFLSAAARINKASELPPGHWLSRNTSPRLSQHVLFKHIYKRPYVSSIQYSISFFCTLFLSKEHGQHRTNNWSPIHSFWCYNELQMTRCNHGSHVDVYTIHFFPNIYQSVDLMKK